MEIENKKLNKIKVIVPFYNPGDFLDACIHSVLTQNYDNYEVLFVDDASTDESYLKIPAIKFETEDNGKPKKDSNGEVIIIEKHPLLEKTKAKNVYLWRSNKRNTALPNIYNGVINYCKDPEDICVLVDGDDVLMKGALSYLNEFYEKEKCLVQYGSCVWTDGRKDFSSPYSENEFKNLRKSPFRVSHLRSFKSKVFFEIQKQDPDYKCFKEESDGTWYTSCYDVPLMFALMEISGFENVKHNSKPIYMYNRENPISDDRVDQFKQTRIHMEVANKKPFKKMEF